MKTALIGYTGFVGSTLLRFQEFTKLYRSTNIHEIRNESFDLVVCAGASAKKWYANLHPEEDKAGIDMLMDNLATVQTKQFVLVSTVDVFKTPQNVDESTPVILEGLHPYGTNRRRLELFVTEKFANRLIVRLPGLVGKGLKKNILYDFLHNNNVNQIESRNIFQFYPMNNLWKDIQTALKHNLDLIHLTSEPVLVSDIAKECFGMDFTNELDKPLVSYDFQSMHAERYWSNIKYQYTVSDTLNAIKQYINS